MNSELSSRRHFLAQTGLAGLALGLGARSASAVEPFKRTGAPRLELSLAAYSFREYFAGGKKAADKTIDMLQFIDFCAENGCAGAELTSYYFPKEPTDAYLLSVRRHAFLKGVAISGTAVGNNFALPKGEKRDEQIASVKKWIDRAAVLGAPHIRVFAGAAAQGLADADARKLCIGALEEVSEYAGTKGIFLGLENHGGIVAEPEGLLEIVKTVKSDWLGINLDSGNFHTEDPYASLAECAPYAVNVQYKVEIQRKGKKENEASDLSRVVKLLRDANYQGWVALEYEAKEDPWKVVPPTLKSMKDAFVA
jgi:sugar phosphate isomerase/epimerase